MKFLLLFFAAVFFFDSCVCHPPGRGPSRGKGPPKQKCTGDKCVIIYPGEAGYDEMNGSTALSGTATVRPTVIVVPHNPFPMFGYSGIGMNTGMGRYPGRGMFPSMGTGNSNGWGGNYGYGIITQYPGSQQQIDGQLGFPLYPMLEQQGRPPYFNLSPGQGQYPKPPPVVNEPGINSPIPDSEIINFSLPSTGGVP